MLTNWYPQKRVDFREHNNELRSRLILDVKYHWSQQCGWGWYSWVDSKFDLPQAVPLLMINLLICCSLWIWMYRDPFQRFHWQHLGSFDWKLNSINISKHFRWWDVKKVADIRDPLTEQNMSKFPIDGWERLFRVKIQLVFNDTGGELDKQFSEDIFLLYYDVQ